ncbi:PTS sugar transporter subunit IIB [Enterococcus sp. BWB1-3]|uniref:PTS system mannose/fructose/N-acetylgalactosamine-transporter subunit IIB n=1 Tax=unclassified Enterococcus TaxID=2608891 RepID=UPI001923D95D|nr:MULTISPECIES: PTS sugar transporter subunit IIB [unclassified Enterococcus]MBL1229682.1 PTS sugar transporter subunit IIB [Enterococcus sp. BWB1-3]MCB5952816.1 PTS sugar transporter subunit IIB [Enterococcus sp. BWT-B8]MCB5953821.1 PTS sugar transporter subunit IIB [Enterococcus sp. CWB-B31]
MGIVLARIDDRLIHGQVMTSWLNYTGANRIIIVDEETANDTFLKMIVTSVAPANIRTEVFDIEGGAEILSNLGESDKVIVLVKSPSCYVELLKRGVALEKVNIGGMGAKEGRSKFYKNISASEEEKGWLKELIDNGVNVSIQIIAEDKSIDVSKLVS